MTVAAPTLLDRVHTAVASVCDPEFPNVTISQLGILEDVSASDDGRVVVELVPTFLGCPALDIIEADVRNAAESVTGVSDVEVRFMSDHVWTPDRISPEGRRNLAELTIAVRDDSHVALCPVCGSKHVVERSPFGPTACRAIAFCENCRNAVEVIRQ